MKQLLFVDDEARILQGLQRQLHGMRDEWKMDFVQSGAKALEFMAASPVDVLVTDMQMPGMDGAQLLTEVRDSHPDTVRLVLSGQANAASVLKLVGPAHQFISKPCDPRELRNAIGRSFALRDLLSNEQLKRLAARVNSLPTLPSLYVQLVNELRKEYPDINLVCEIVSQDLGLTTKMLQLVNSAFFGLPQPMSRTADAVQYLGLNTVRDLVLSLQIFSQFDQKTLPDFSIEELFQHGWQTANLARKIGVEKQCDFQFHDHCFLAGLLHDVGKLVLASGLPEQYAQVLNAARKEKLPLWKAEKAEYGTTHAEVGGYLLALWGLPAPIIEAVTLHHRPEEAFSRGFSPVIVVHVANLLASNPACFQPDWPGTQTNLNCPSEPELENLLEIWQSNSLEQSTLAAAI